MRVDQQVGPAGDRLGDGGQSGQIRVDVAAPDRCLDGRIALVDEPSRAPRPLLRCCPGDARGVRRQLSAIGAAEQLVDRQIEQLAREVPEGDIDSGDRLHLVAANVAAQALAAVHVVPVPLDGEWILPKQKRSENVLDHRLGRGGTERGVRFTPANRAVVGGDLHQAGLGLGWIGADVEIADFAQRSGSLGNNLSQMRAS